MPKSIKGASAPTSRRTQIPASVIAALPPHVAELLGLVLKMNNFRQHHALGSCMEILATQRRNDLPEDHVAPVLLFPQQKAAITRRKKAAQAQGVAA